MGGDLGPLVNESSDARNDKYIYYTRVIIIFNCTIY